MQTNSLAFRLAAGAAVWSAAALISGGLTLSAMFRDNVERNFDARLSVLLEGLVAASELQDNGSLALGASLGEPRFEQPFSGWYWQIRGPNGLVLRSRSLWDQLLPGGDGAAHYHGNGPENQRLRVATRNILLPGSDAPFGYAVGGDAAEPEREVKRFNNALMFSLGVLGLGLLVAVVVQVRHGLRPLRQMSEALANMRAGRAERLEARLPTEIAPLANELNALLDHNAAVVERARSHVGNLAHALKTPLSVLTNEARDDGPLACIVRRQTTLMRRHVDHHLVRARAAGSGGIVGARTRVAEPVEDLRRTLTRIHADRDITIAAQCPSDVVFRGERQDLEEIIGNLLDNACKWAQTRVRIEVSVSDNQLEVVVEDDGAGLEPEQRAEVLQRGKRLDESVPGSGLGLSIVRDIAELYGGSVTLGAASIGGLSAVVRLPGSTDQVKH